MWILDLNQGASPHDPYSLFFHSKHEERRAMNLEYPSLIEGLFIGGGFLLFIFVMISLNMIFEKGIRDGERKEQKRQTRSDA